MSSNNIYNILGKLAALAPKAEVEQKTTQKIYESVEAKGSVLEGVGAVEQMLAEKYMGFKKTAAAVAKNPDVKDPEAVAAAIGRKKYGKAAFQKAAAAGKAMGEGADELCAECGMTEAKCGCLHEGETEKTERGIKHKGTYGTEYQGDTDDEEEEQRKFDKGVRKKGRPSKGGAKKAKAKAKDSGEKKGKGRPKKADSEKSQAHLPWGGKPPKTDANPTKKWPKDKTTVHKIAEKAPPGDKAERMVKHIKAGYANDGALTPKEKSIAYATTWKAHKAGTVEEGMSKIERRLTEGVNFAELLKEKHQSVDEMLAQLNDDIKLFKDTGHCSELLRDCMEIKGYHGKMMADEAANLGGIPGNLPPSQVPGKTELLNPPKPGVVGAVKDVAQGLKNFVTGKPETGPTYEEVTMEDELNELARLAGLSTEGNAFTGKLKDTPKGGKFELDGKEFTDTSTLDEEPNEGNAFSGAVAKAKTDGVQPGEKITVGGKEYPVKEAMSDVNKEYWNNRGQLWAKLGRVIDSVKTPEQFKSAQKYATLMRTELGRGTDDGIGGDWQLVKDYEAITSTLARKAKELGLEVKDNFKEADVQNAPHEQYGTVKQITTQGDDMNRQKRQDPGTANRAANPLTNDTLAEYESIKKVSK